MFLKSITKNNITRLYFYESYYKDKKSRQRLVKSLGRLDELEKSYSDPVSYFTALAKKETLEQKADKNMSITIDLSATLEVDEKNIKNIGYGILKILYSELELDKFWKAKTRKSLFKYD
ncbi:MAG: transposase, partial [Clostridiales bacterium]|nr:transposase [Clostridiales bacterium]